MGSPTKLAGMSARLCNLVYLMPFREDRSMQRMKKIDIEEHFNAVGFEEYAKAFVSLIDSDAAEEINRKLADFDEIRLATMDKYGIDYVILSQTGPSVQTENDLALAVQRSRENNDFLARRIAENPTRYGGFATL